MHWILWFCGPIAKLPVELIREQTGWPEAMRAGAVAIGNFDGVHQGHARIVKRLLEVARQTGGPAVVFTFDPHPVRILRPTEAPPPLTWTDRKAQLLGELGVDYMVAYPTDEALLQLSAEEFFSEVVERRLARGHSWKARTFISAAAAAEISRYYGASVRLRGCRFRWFHRSRSMAITFPARACAGCSTRAMLKKPGDCSRGRIGCGEWSCTG